MNPNPQNLESEYHLDNRPDNSVPLFEEPKNPQNRQSTPYVANSSVHQPTTQEENRVIEGLAFWLRFAAVMVFISAGVTILMGIATLFVIFGVFIIFAGVFQIVLGRKLWRASNYILTINQTNDAFSFRMNIYKALADLKYYYKWTGIWTIIYLATIPVFFVSMLGLMFTFYNNLNMNDFPNFDCKYTRAEDKLKYCSNNKSNNGDTPPRLNLDFPSD